MNLGTILSLIVTTVPAILSDTGVIPPGIAALVEKLGAALPAQVASLVAGKGPTDEMLSILSALQTELAALRASGLLAPDKLQLADSLDTALADALTGYQDAEAETDPTKLTQLPTDLTPGDAQPRQT